MIHHYIKCVLKNNTFPIIVVTCRNFQELQYQQLRVVASRDLEMSGIAPDISSDIVWIFKEQFFLMEDTVYYGELINSNHRVSHSSDAEWT